MLLAFENEFHHAFSNKKCAGCGHLQVALSCTGCACCHSQVTITCVQKSFEKAAHKDVDEIDPWLQKMAADLS